MVAGCINGYLPTKLLACLLALLPFAAAHALVHFCLHTSSHVYLHATVCGLQHFIAAVFACAWSYAQMQVGELKPLCGMMSWLGKSGLIRQCHT